MTVLPWRLPTSTQVAVTQARRAGVHDDLEQRHFVDRAEVVHPDDGLGAARRLGDAADRQRRGVRREDRRRGRPTASTSLTTLVLELQVFEDGLDDQAGA
jgi:hypothetical protein